MRSMFQVKTTIDSFLYDLWYGCKCPACCWVAIVIGIAFLGATWSIWKLTWSPFCCVIFSKFVSLFLWHRASFLVMEIWMMFCYCPKPCILCVLTSFLFHFIFIVHAVRSPASWYRSLQDWQCYCPFSMTQLSCLGCFLRNIYNLPICSVDQRPCSFFL